MKKNDQKFLKNTSFLCSKLVSFHENGFEQRGPELVPVNGDFHDVNHP